MQYEFDWQVKDREAKADGAFFTHNEKKDEATPDRTEGEYRVWLPDGRYGFYKIIIVRFPKVGCGLYGDYFYIDMPWYQYYQYYMIDYPCLTVNVIKNYTMDNVCTFRIIFKWESNQ